MNVSGLTRDHLGAVVTLDNDHLPIGCRHGTLKAITPDVHDTTVIRIGNHVHVAPNTATITVQEQP